MGNLSPMAVKHAKPGKHADGGGLYLVVSPSGAKTWLLRTQHEGRRREYGLGSLAVLSLADARDKARETLKEVRNGGEGCRARPWYSRLAAPFDQLRSPIAELGLELAVSCLSAYDRLARRSGRSQVASHGDKGGSEHCSCLKFGFEHQRGPRKLT